eukprot:755709-Hanusia_phi.AAC.4
MEVTIQMNADYSAQYKVAQEHDDQFVLILYPFMTVTLVMISVDQAPTHYSSAEIYHLGLQNSIRPMIVLSSHGHGRVKQAAIFLAFNGRPCPDKVPTPGRRAHTVRRPRTGRAESHRMPLSLSEWPAAAVGPWRRDSELDSRLTERRPARCRRGYGRRVSDSRCPAAGHLLRVPPTDGGRGRRGPRPGPRPLRPAISESCIIR